MRYWCVLLALLVALPMRGGITSAVQKAGGDGCNEFTETTWDDLTGWTQDSGNDFSADATNDELDFSGVATNDQAWIMNDTQTTDSNNCAIAEVVTTPGDETWYGVILRGSTTADDYVYVAGSESATSVFFISQYLVETGGLGWQVDCANSSIVDVTDGDWIAGCVDGTGSGTTIEMWHWDSQPSGNCPADWGTPDLSTTDCTSAGCCVNADQRLIGLFVESGNGGNKSGTFDNVTGGDND